MSRRLFALLIFGALLTLMMTLSGVASSQAKPHSDAKKPTITDPQPAPGSTTSDRTPTISATVSDNKTNLARGHIRLFVDGKHRPTFSYNRQTDGLFYTTPQLSPGWHTVKVTARDTAGNQATKVWKFKVVRKAPKPPVAVAPVVTSTSPANGATGVALEPNIQVTFSQNMDPATINGQTFDLYPGDHFSYDTLNNCGIGCLPASPNSTITYDPASRTATLDPASSLLPNTQYTAVVEGADDNDGRAVTNEAGTPMARDHIFYFTTGAGDDCGSLCQ